MSPHNPYFTDDERNAMKRVDELDAKLKATDEDDYPESGEDEDDREYFRLMREVYS